MASLLEPILKHPANFVLASAPRLVVDIPLKMIELDKWVLGKRYTDKVKAEDEST